MNQPAPAVLESPQAFNALSDGLRVFGAVAFVLALVLALAWLVRRGALRLPGGKSQVPMRIESAASLGERRSMVIVNVEGRRFLLGLTPVQVSMLTELGAGKTFSDALDGRVTADAPEARS